MVLRKKNIKEFIQTKRNSFAGIIAISGVASVMALAIPASMSASSAYNASDKTIEIKTEVVFNQKRNVVELTNINHNIVPGESKVQREERENREAQEKAATEAQAQAQAKVNAESASRKTVGSNQNVYVDPSNFDEIYQRAQAAYGVDWRLLRAVHYVETGCSGSTSKNSYAGAVGPMQFLPSTWRTYGVDGNGDGVADITNVEDAIFAAARYLSACGYPNVQKALWGYNPSSAYYNKVMEVARSIGF